MIWISGSLLNLRVTLSEAVMPHPAVRDFKDLIVWQKSIDLLVEVYNLTRHFPREEQFGVTSQLRRAVLSVSSNIAEGSGRGTTKDLVSFLTNSRGSLYESQSLLIVSQRLEILTESEASKACALGDEVGRMLSRLRSNLKSRITNH